MMKRSLLAVAVSALTSQAVYAAPYMPMDARGMAMGNTGVASAKRAHAPAYNPSLLAQGSEKDDFAILLPQVGVQASDEQEIIDEAELLSDDIIPRFEKAVEGDENSIVALKSIITDFINTQNSAPLENRLDEVGLSVDELDASLKNISGNPLSANLGLNFALAIPSKKFAAALSIGGTAGISGRVNYSPDDSKLLTSYVGEVNGLIDFYNSINGNYTGQQLPQSEIIDYNPFLEDGTTPNSNFLNLTDKAKDPNFSSTVQVVAVAIADIGISFAREFEFAGEKVAIGITPKLQKISTFHYADEVDGFDDVDSDTFKDTQQDYTRANLDIGASYRFGASEKWMVGLTGKNLLGGEFDYAGVLVTPKKSDGTPTGAPAYKLEGGSVELNPQFRAGVAYNGEWTSIALDVDLVENDPVAFENPTQYAALGVELDVFSFLQLRAGYRTNMSVSGDDVASIGVGLSPFGLHVDIAAMANLDEPKKNAGAALQLGFYF